MKDTASQAVQADHGGGPFGLTQMVRIPVKDLTAPSSHRLVTYTAHPGDSGSHTLIVCNAAK